MAAAPPSRTPPPKPAPVQYLLPPDFAEWAGDRYHAESDGRVYEMRDGQKSYVPPWIVWQNSNVGKDPATGQLTEEGRAYRTPGSDPSSKWRFMYEASGPFRKGSQWDAEEGTYKGSVDWGTLIGTIVAGGIIGAGAVSAIGGAGAAGGAGADVGAATTVPELGAVAPVLEGTAAGTGAATTAAGLGTAPIAAETGATVGLSSGAGLPGAAAIPTVADLATTGSAVAGTTAATTVADTAAASTPGVLSKTLSSLTSPSVLSTIASGALSAYGANKAADAQTDAASIVANANTAAAKIQADASTEAAKIQAQSTKDALDFAKQGYADESARYEQNQQQLSPYTGAGGAAVTKLSQLLGLGTPPPYVSAVKPPAAPTPTIAPMPSGPAPLPTQMTGKLSSLAPQTLAPSADMVSLRAPTGEVEQKPAAEAQHWISLGAQPVQQGATA